MGVGFGRAEAGIVLKAGNLAIALQGAQIRPAIGNDRLGSGAEGARVHIARRVSNLQHIDIRPQVGIDAQRLQIMGDAMSKLCCVIHIPRLVCLHRARTVPKNILHPLYQPALFVGGDDQGD